MKIQELYDEAGRRLAADRAAERDAFYVGDKKSAANDVSFLIEVRSALKRKYRTIKEPRP